VDEALHPLRHGDRDPANDPTGERLLDRAVRPWDAWVPDAPAIVLGNSQLAERELNVDAVLRDGIPIHKRISGGGAVVLSPGCACLGLRFRKNKALTIQDYFAMGSSLIVDAAKAELGLELFLRGTSDLACESIDGVRKVAGSALYMPRDFVLYLVSILVRPDMEQIERYLAHPSKEPDYRAGRGHGTFLASLESLSGKSIAPAKFAGWLSERIPPMVGEKLDREFITDEAEYGPGR
jgi:lipoate-protein ligase A